MTRLPTITGVVLTLNEEQNLGNALSSLKWCDRTLVVDSGSTDATKQVALSHGADFITRIPDGPFLISEQRNLALDYCCNYSDWVLFLDADETISNSLSQQLIATLTSEKSFSAYFMAPRYWFMGKWLKKTQAFPNWHPRVVKTSSNVRFTGGVWETFNSTKTVGYIDHPYEHYSFSKGIDEWIIRHLRYADHEADQVISFLKEHDSSLISPRKKHLRMLLAQHWRFRPLATLVNKLFIQGGIFEGYVAVVFVLLMCCYDLFVILKIMHKTTPKSTGKASYE